jgi:hypothetical protein
MATALGLAQADMSKAVGHGAFPVRVNKTIESSKLKEGDAVEVETAGSFKLPDGTLVPKGSKLAGHVTEAKSRSKGDSDSQLTISFEKLNVADGKQVLVKGMVQAVFPSSDEVDLGANAMPSTAAGGSTRGGSAGGNVGIVNTKPGSDTEASGSVQASMNPKSVGVQGIKDLQLENGVLSSKGKQVKLGVGVRMIVHVDILG